MVGHGARRHGLEPVRTLLVVLGISVLAPLPGCDGSSIYTGEPCPAGATLTLAPRPQAVTAGGSSVTFQASLIGCTELIVWNLAGPGRLSLNQGTSVVYTPPQAVAAPADATITITAGGLSDLVIFTVNP